MNLRFPFIVLLILALFCVGFGATIFLFGGSEVFEGVLAEFRRSPVAEEQNGEPAPLPKTKLFFVGDIMLDRGVRKSVEKNFQGDYSRLFEKVGFLKEADILFANLEGPVSSRGRDKQNLYSFRMATTVIPALESAGFDVVSVANNHMEDWGKEAFLDTLSFLAKSNIRAAGGGLSKSDASEPEIIIKNNLRFGFLAFSDVGPEALRSTEIEPGILLADDPSRLDIIAEASKKSDVLIVSYHFGDEYQTLSNSRQKNLARTSIDAGAKLVIGHHPHVIQELENYNGGLIIYSLGNFIFDQYFSEETMQGLLLEVVFEGKDIDKVKTNLVNISDSYQPSFVNLK